jgi:3-carboxy-cis,cis-muconate cycloisomerase
MQGLYERIFYSEKLAMLYTDEALIGYMLRFESALAEAQAKHGIFPGEAAAVIQECCRAEHLDKEKLTEDAAQGGNLAIPLIKQLTAVVKQKEG